MTGDLLDYMLHCTIPRLFGTTNIANALFMICVSPKILILSYDVYECRLLNGGKPAQD